MENECEALPGVAYTGVRDNRSTLNTKTGYDDDDDIGLRSWMNIMKSISVQCNYKVVNYCPSLLTAYQPILAYVA